VLKPKQEAGRTGYDLAGQKVGSGCRIT
jgi:hypothetical protein